jgi:Lar family restriction alleviation protein
MSELKPCPFCGGEAKLIRTHPNPAIDWGGRYGTTVWEVYCSNTDCPCEAGTGWKNTEAEAIEAWNTRHDERVDFLEEVEVWAFYNMECCDGDEWELFTSIYGAIAKYRRAAYGG